MTSREKSRTARAARKSLSVSRWWPQPRWRRWHGRARAVLEAVTPSYYLYEICLVSKLTLPPEGPTAICCDNKGVTDIARDPVSTNALKHVKRRHFFVRELQDAGEVVMVPVASSANVADVFTKALAEPRFTGLAKRLRGCFSM